MSEKCDVIRGAESFFFKGSSTGVLICHGFGGTPQSIRALGEQFASKGFTVFGLRLKGHGTHYEDLERSTYLDWIKSIEDAFEFLKKQVREVFVIGQSMGGTLTLYLASKHPEIKGIILINAAMTTIPTFEAFKNKTEPRYINEEKPDIKAKDAYEITYNKTPIESINQLLVLMQKTKNELANVRCPILAFKSAHDHVVPPKNTDFIIDHTRSKHKTVIPLFNSYHVASLDYEKEFIAEKCCEFINHPELTHSKVITII